MIFRPFFQRQSGGLFWYDGYNERWACPGGGRGGIKYKRVYCREVREYFGSFIGYWERRMEKLEARLIVEDWEARSKALEDARQAAIQKGVVLMESMADMVDPESVRQRARIKAYHMLLEEMEVKKRMEGLPSLEKWAKKIGVHPSTVSRWRQDHEEFDAACADCLAIQTDILRDGGLSGVYNGRLVTFLMERNEQRAQDADERSVGYTQMEDFEDD